MDSQDIVFELVAFLAEVKKERQIVTTAMELFYANGIYAVRINEILKTSGIVKKILYRYFDGKEALIVETLNTSDEKTLLDAGKLLKSQKKMFLRMTFCYQK